MKKKILSLILCLCIIAGALPLAAMADEPEKSGTCGESLGWELDDSGRLRIYGTGEMESFSGSAPWQALSSEIKSVVIEKGVTSISNNAFRRCAAIESVSFPNTLVSIGDNAFGLCTALTELYIPNSVKSLGESAFYNCSSLETVVVGNGLETLPINAFSTCSKLYSAFLGDGVSVIDIMAFYNCSALSDLRVGAKLKEIGFMAFTGCDALSSVSYDGSMESWNSIELASGNQALANVQVIRELAHGPEVVGGNAEKSGQVTLSWKAIDGAAKYKIYRSDSYGDGYKLMYTTTKTSYTNTTSKVNRTYYYMVVAVLKDGEESASSNIVERSGACAQPVVKGSGNQKTGQPSLTWAKVEGAMEYEIYRSGYKNGKYTRMYTTTKTSYTNTTAKPGSEYYYKVKAISSETSDSDSAMSAAVNRVCDCAKPVIKSVGLYSGHPQLSWSKVDGATKYVVYRATSKNGTYTKIATTSALTHINVTAKAGTLYYYKLVAINANSYADSARSDAVSIRAR